MKIFWNVVGSPLEGVIGLGSNGSSFPTTGGATTSEVALEIVEAEDETRYFFPGFRADYDQMMDALRPQLSAGAANADGVTPVTVVLTDQENGTTETYVFGFRRDFHGKVHIFP